MVEVLEDFKLIFKVQLLPSVLGGDHFEDYELVVLPVGPHLRVVASRNKR